MFRVLITAALAAALAACGTANEPPGRVAMSVWGPTDEVTVFASNAVTEQRAQSLQTISLPGNDRRALARIELANDVGGHRLVGLTKEAVDRGLGYEVHLASR